MNRFKVLLLIIGLLFVNSYSQKEWHVKLGLGSFDLSFHSNFLSINDYNDYNGKYLTDSDKKDILDKLDGDINVKSYIYSRFLLFETNEFRLGYETVGSAFYRSEDDVIRLLLEGNNYNERYTFEPKIESAVYSTFFLSYKVKGELFNIPNLLVIPTIGVNKGWYGFQTRTANGYLETSDNTMTVSNELTLTESKGGWGMKLDLGSYYEYNKNFSFSLSFDNLINSVSWDTDVTDYYYSAYSDSLAVVYMDSDSIFQTDDYDAPGEDFSTNIPIIITLTAYHNISPKLKGEYSLIQGVSDDYHASVIPELEGRIFYRPADYFQLSGSLSVGGSFGIAYSGGIDFIIGNSVQYKFGLGLGQTGSIIPGDQTGMKVSFNNEIAF